MTQRHDRQQTKMVKNLRALHTYKFKKHRIGTKLKVKSVSVSKFKCKGLIIWLGNTWCYD